MNLIPPQLQAYALLIKVGAAVAIVIGAFGYGHHRGARGEAMKNEAAVSQAKSARIQQYENQIAAQKKSIELLAAQSSQLDMDLRGLEDSNRSLQDTVNRLKLVKHEPNPIPGGAPVVRLSASFRVCINAAIIGTADAATDCQAAGMRESPTP